MMHFLCLTVFASISLFSVALAATVASNELNFCSFQQISVCNPLNKPCDGGLSINDLKDPNPAYKLKLDSSSTETVPVYFGKDKKVKVFFSQWESLDGKAQIYMESKLVQGYRVNLILSKKVPQIGTKTDYGVIFRLSAATASSSTHSCKADLPDGYSVKDIKSVIAWEDN